MPLNFELMKNWQNWFIIILMLMIAGFAFDLILTKLTEKGN